jgi:hypothetical protein
MCVEHVEPCVTSVPQVYQHQSGAVLWHEHLYERCVQCICDVVTNTMCIRINKNINSECLSNRPNSVRQVFDKCPSINLKYYFTTNICMNNVFNVSVM